MKKILSIIAFIFCYSFNVTADNIIQDFLFRENSYTADPESHVAYGDPSKIYYSYSFDSNDLMPCDIVPPGFPCFDPDPGTVPVGEGIGVLIILSLLYGLRFRQSFFQSE